MQQLTLINTLSLSRVQSRWRDLPWHIAALLIPLILALLVTWPVALNIGERIPGWEGDNIGYVWVIYWLKQVLVHGGSIFWDPLAYYPLGFNNATNEVTPANTFLALPVALLFGPVVAYNVVLLLSFVLTSYATFLWIKTLTHHNAIALAIGIASAFLPYRLAHLPGHLPQMAMQWIPLCFYGVECYLTKGRTRWALVIGAFFALTALSSWYYLVFIVFALPVYFLLRAPHGRRWLGRWGFWRDMALAATLAAAAILPFAVPAILAQQRSDMHRDINEINLYAINPLEFMTLSTRHPVWGEFAAQRIPIAQKQNIVERIVMPGYLFSALALVGIVFNRRRRIVRTLVGLGLVGTVCAMGPVLVDIKGVPVRVPITQEIAQWLQERGFFGIATQWLGSDLAGQMQAEHFVVVPLPYVLLYRLPVVASIRAVGRYAVLMNLAVCGLAALGIDALVRRRRSRHWSTTGRFGLSLAVMLVGIWAVFEFWQVPYDAVWLKPRPVDEWLAAQPRGTVIELPPGHSERGLSLFQRITHQQPVVLGLAGSFPPPAHAERLKALNHLTDPDTVAQLCLWSTRYVLLDASRNKVDVVAKWKAKLEAIPQLRYDRQIGDVLVYLAMGCDLTALR